MWRFKVICSSFEILAATTYYLISKHRIVMSKHEVDVSFKETMSALEWGNNEHHNKKGWMAAIAAIGLAAAIFGLTATVQNTTANHLAASWISDGAFVRATDFVTSEDHMHPQVSVLHADTRMHQSR